ncbi:MAG: hypothetical protein QM811_14775 [Pirellulales bacterium]
MKPFLTHSRPLVQPTNMARQASQKQLRAAMDNRVTDITVLDSVEGRIASIHDASARAAVDEFMRLTALTVTPGNPGTIRIIGLDGATDSPPTSVQLKAVQASQPERASTE